MEKNREGKRKEVKEEKGDLEVGREVDLEEFGTGAVVLWRMSEMRNKRATVLPIGIPSSHTAWVRY